jgi:hypothetical protein
LQENGLWELVELSKGILAHLMFLLLEGDRIRSNVGGILPGNGGDREPSNAIEVQEISRTEVKALIIAQLLGRHEADDAADSFCSHAVSPSDDQRRCVRVQVASAATVESVVSKGAMTAGQPVGKDPNQELGLVPRLDPPAQIPERLPEFGDVLRSGFHRFRTYAAQRRASGGGVALVPSCISFATFEDAKR